MAAILQLTAQFTCLQRKSLILDIHKSMLWSIDTCPNKVSADQYHVIISLAQVESSWRAVFFKFTTDQVLVSDWIAGTRQAKTRLP